MSWLLHKLSAHLPLRIIFYHGKPYLERYYLCSFGKRRFYLHRFVASDPDNGTLHDHPWEHAWSVVLSGFYLEQRRRIGWGALVPIIWFNHIRGDKFHRVVLPNSINECWTLFTHGKRVKAWGFWKQELVTQSLAVWTEQRSFDGEETKWWRTAPLGKDHLQRAKRGNPGRII